MYDAYTENLTDFGFREIKELRDILDAWVKHGLPSDFERNGVRPAMNRNSGYVFLVNGDYQCAMLNGGTLESFYSSPYDGREGFFNDLVEEFSEMHPEDQEWLRSIADNIGRELPAESEAAE